METNRRGRDTNRAGPIPAPGGWAPGEISQLSPWRRERSWPQTPGFPSPWFQCWEEESTQNLTMKTSGDSDCQSETECRWKPGPPLKKHTHWLALRHLWAPTGGGSEDWGHARDIRGKTELRGFGVRAEETVAIVFLSSSLQGACTWVPSCLCCTLPHRANYESILASEIGSLTMWLPEAPPHPTSNLPMASSLLGNRPHPVLSSEGLLGQQSTSLSSHTSRKSFSGRQPAPARASVFLERI